MSGNKILRGAAVLGIAGLMVKLLGAFFRIPLQALIGEEGMAYYGYAYPLYSLFLVIATAGIPVAISRLVSEKIALKDYEGAHRVFKVSGWMLFFIGLFSFAVCYFGAEFISEHVIGDMGALKPLKAIAPALIFVPVMSAFRGYFQGRQNMNPTAVSQFVEQIFRVGVGLALAYALLDVSLDSAAAGATFGATAGSVAGLLVIVLIYFMSKKVINYNIKKNRSHGARESSKSIIKQILIIAVPITIGSSILPLVNAADSMLVTRRLLDGGFSIDEARILWGQLSGYCNTMVGLPQVITQSVAIAMVPAVAGAFRIGQKNEVHENVNLASAAPTLMIMCISVALMSVLQTTTGILQAINKQMIPVKNMAIGAVGKVVLTYILVAIPALNIKGAAIGSIFVYAVALVLNMQAVIKYTGTRVNMSLAFVKPTAASLIMGICAFASYKLIYMVLESNTMATMIAILIGIIVYGVLILGLRAITKEEIERIPGGYKLAKILDKFIK